ncbi:MULTISPECIES: hypothetical protein [unclassified Streptomyces]|uniref:hypothetical protein n=1 Tax=unclassified Streptomyces TaxID=2593676 RepID=UPI0033E6402D
MHVRHLAAGLTALLCAIVTPAAAGPAAQAESNGGVRVMPLGDSITDGFNDLVPLADPAAEERAQRFDAAVPGVVSALAARGRHVHFVPMHSALTTADLADGVHPTGGGGTPRWPPAGTPP